ncbi:MAG: glutamine--fructose-6-phosphate transaminase (isomerizing), partial [Deltaproteobacteria bacterium]|nr:glutamine--fructose-6-phosphate transaminase (isomerizing) [Deltaproteobacteria bacterium]
MCGIVGYVGNRPVQEILLAGLEKLEYRGYDSAGITAQGAGGLEAVRAVGNLAHLRSAVEARDERGGGVAVLAPPATTGIGHTRWATHGRVSEANAHPHFDTADRVHVVVNGIVENYMELKHGLLDAGAEFTSETDAEVIAHLISSHLEGNGLEQAVRLAYARLRGHYAFVAVAADEPGVIVAARKECPLVVGRGDGEQFVGSAIPAFLEHTRRVQLIENDEIVIVTADDVRFTCADGTAIERAIEEIHWSAEVAEKGGYETFMLKEIHEQAEAVAETIADRTARPDGVDLGDLGSIDDQFLRTCRRVVVVACGTSYHAGLIGRYAIEEWARLGVEMDVASEYRYRNPVIGPGDLVIGISQSGETADTLAAMRLARERGAKVLALTNAMGSQATRDSDGVLFARSGLEIGVAATKTFVAQVASMYLLALRLAELRGTLDPARLAELIVALKRIPHCIEELLKTADGAVERIAQTHFASDFFLYLGRHVGLPVALEGALKLKEISYIATDAYAAGEMKHGPIALLDEQTPVVCVATDSPVLEKVISNIQEVRARGAHVIAVASEGNP